MLDDAQIEIGIRLLATTTATMTPLRFTMNVSDFPTHTAIHERQNAFAKGLGVPFTGGGSAAARQTFSRDFTELCEGGLAERCGGTGRGSHARLTEYGEAFFRKLCGCYTIDTAFPLLKLLDLLTDNQSGCQTYTPLLHERDVVGVPHEELTSPDVVGLELLACPLLCTGMVTATGDTRQTLRYALTDFGRTTLAQGPPPLPDGMPDCDDDAAELYDQAFREVFNGRASWEPERTHCLTIPLPATGSWLDVYPVSDEAKALQRELFGERAGRWTHHEHFAPGGAGYDAEWEKQRQENAAFWERWNAKQAAGTTSNGT